ncbi:hypothetical protein RI103_18365 [Paraburkholderia sp. FT54]|jgi:hypothetical protein|uniref:hypothetical protein n=1 Tax=Paraburkholderia sp. FT54 TaxID=3074437 RepID=UPI002877E85F|nr:hypothetical protein [Paraburkholderia sp. FT54]WNC89613.1 hypothetical protein RI103_18365 [Paraburkholderia sp. FT54]
MTAPLGKTLIVPASRPRSPTALKPGAAGVGLLIFAAVVKIHQGFQSLVIPKFCFRYNGLHAQGIVLPQDDASPSKMGARIVTQVWAVALLDGHQVSMLSMHTSCPARRRAPATDLTAVTLGGAYAAVPAR